MLSRLTRAFTCIELLVFIILIACVAFGAAKMVAVVPGTWGVLLGMVAGMALFLLSGILFFLILDIIYGGIPRLPRCSQGTCRGSKDYQTKPFGDKYYLVCRHGNRYARRGRRFVYVSEDGIEEPYLVWIPFSGWHQDSR